MTVEILEIPNIRKALVLQFLCVLIGLWVVVNACITALVPVRLFRDFVIQ
jgi:hypothetical protein